MPVSWHRVQYFLVLVTFFNTSFATSLSSYLINTTKIKYYCTKIYNLQFIEESHKITTMVYPKGQ